MGLAVSGVTETGSRVRTPKFMAQLDISTVDAANAKKIGEFLKDSKLQEARKTELANYLMTYKNKDGSSYFTTEEAYELASKQLDNEKAQARAKITVPFIDPKAYEAVVKRAKEEGREDAYEFKLITNKKVLAMINGDNITDPAEKEANYKKYFLTNEKGELIKDTNGNYIFDPDKYKAEMVKDTGTDYKLQLSEREEAAFKRGLSKNAEKDAIKATGLDIRRDNTGLYKSLAGVAALAAIIFGAAEATATADAVAGSVASASSHAITHGAQIAGAAAGLFGMAFLQDKDGKINKRQIVADLFNLPPNGPEMPGLSLARLKIPTGNEQLEFVKEEPCYTLEKGVTVKTIRYGGYWHYANLYNDCVSGKKLTSAQIKELTQLLKPGHGGSSMQKGDSNKEKVLPAEVTLSDGTRVCLADKDTVNSRIVEMEEIATPDPLKKSQLRVAEHNISVKDCDTGEYIGSAADEQSAHAVGRKYQLDNIRFRLVPQE